VATIEQVLKLFAQPIFTQIRALKCLELTPRQHARLRKSIKEDIRACGGLLFPDVKPPQVSKVAQQEAERIGVAIHTKSWLGQNAFDPGRKTFHWEHITPVSCIQGLCEEADSEGAILRILKDRLRIAWILKREDEELTRLGYRIKRIDPPAAYLAAKIELLPS